MRAESKRSYGTPFKSKLRPYVDQIRKWRRAGFTWAEIAEKLGELGCQTHATNLCQFMRRYRKRPFPSGAEPEIPDVRSTKYKTREERQTSGSERLFNAVLRRAGG